MDNTEVFELCETSSKKQCTDFLGEIGIVYCGRSPKKTLAKDQTVGQEELRPLVNSRLRHQKRTSPMVPNMELPNGNECTTKPRRSCRKLANPSMVVTKPFWKDGTRMTNTAFCQILGGLRSRLFSMTNLHWKTTLILQQERKELETRKMGCSSLVKKVFKDH